MRVKCELYNDHFQNYKRYEELRQMEAAGKIEELSLQVPFQLIPKQTEIDAENIWN